MSQESGLKAGEKPEIIDVKGDVHSEKSKESEVGFKDYFRILSYSDKLDWTLNGVGTVAACASGASLALYVRTYVRRPNC